MYPIFCKVGKGYKPWVFMVIDVISEVLVQDEIKHPIYGTSRMCQCAKDITRRTSEWLFTNRLNEYWELMEGDTPKIILQDNDLDIPLCKFVYHSQCIRVLATSYNHAKVLNKYWTPQITWQCRYGHKNKFTKVLCKFLSKSGICELQQDSGNQE